MRSELEIKTRFSQDAHGCWHYDQHFILIPRFFTIDHVLLRVWNQATEITSKKVPKTRWYVKNNVIMLNDGLEEKK